MSSFPVSNFPGFGDSIVLPASSSTTRGKSYFRPRITYHLARLSTDAVGTFTLSLVNAVIGSRYRVELSGDGSLVDTGVISSNPQNITLSYYAGGSPNNNLRIKVRKASGSPNYKAFETQAVAAAGTQSVYIAQVLDE